MSAAAPAHGVVLGVAYDGTAFSGWATQRDARTVEDTLRGAILEVDPRARGPRGASRTDAGVHARAQLVALDSQRALPPRAWVLMVNKHLPRDVCVRWAAPAPLGFDPRGGSHGKRYVYTIVRDRVRDPLLGTRAWRVGQKMNVERMRREAATVMGTHDFGAFRSASDVRKHTVRTLHRVDVDEGAGDPRFLHVTVEGSAFLHNMVRILVGSLVDVGCGRLPEGTLAAALRTQDRRDLGQTAPPDGLVLEEVFIDAGVAGERWPR